MKRKVFKKLPVLLAIMFVLFQSFLVPLAGASWSGTSWKGDAWKGDSWSGDAWNTEGFSWEGEAWDPGKGWIQDGWEQDGWTQEGYTKDGWTGDGISAIDPATGQPWTGDKVNGIDAATGQPWTGDKVNGIDPATGQPWTGDKVNGIDPATGQPWTGNGINGINPATGQPWIGNGNNGINPATGQPWAGQNGRGINPATGLPWIGNELSGTGLIIAKSGSSNASGNGEDISLYDILKFTNNNVLSTKVNLPMQIMNNEFSFKKPNDVYGLILGGFKLGMGDSSKTLNGISEAYDVSSAGYETFNGIKTLMNSGFNATTSPGQYESLARTASRLSQTTSQVNPALKLLSKASLATAAIGTGFSVVDTVKNTNAAVETFKNNNSSGADKTVAVASIGESVGEAFMNAGAGAMAIPGLQVAGTWMITIGAGTFLLSKGTKYVASNWGSIKNGIGKAKKKVGSIFKSIKGAFS